MLQGKNDDAEPLYERATKIREKALGPDHPIVATLLTDRAELLQSQVRTIEDFLLISWGPQLLFNRCRWSTTPRNPLLGTQGKFAEDEPLYEKSVTCHTREGASFRAS